MKSGKIVDLPGRRARLDLRPYHEAFRDRVVGVDDARLVGYETGSHHHEGESPIIDRLRLDFDWNGWVVGVLVVKHVVTSDELYGRAALFRGQSLDVGGAAAVRDVGSCSIALNGAGHDCQAFSLPFDRALLLRRAHSATYVFVPHVVVDLPQLVDLADVVVVEQMPEP